MRTPDYTQLTDILAFGLASLRGDADLLAQCDTSADNICRASVGFRAFTQKDDGIMVYATEFPCLAIFPTRWQQALVHGHAGMIVDLGIQYLWKAPVGETGHPMLERASHWLNAVAWKLFKHLLSPTVLCEPTLRSGYTGHIYRCHADSLDLIPMLENNLTGLDGTGQMEVFYPPWAPTAAVPLYDITIASTVTDKTPDPWADDIVTVDPSRPVPEPTP